MIRATKAGHFHAPVADTIVLDQEERRRRRGVLKTVGGLEFLVDLPEAPGLRGGDCYVLEDGRLIEILAAPEELLEVRGKDPLHTTRLAYHLGNRHLECEITTRSIRVRRDHVIADMLTGLGAKVVEIEAPFQPEGGAYHQSGQEAHGQAEHGQAEHRQAEHGHKHQLHVHSDKCDHDHHDNAHDHKHGH